MAAYTIISAQTDISPFSLTPDQTGQSTIFFEPANPFVFADWQDGPLRYDSSLNFALGSFVMRPNPLQVSPDSLANRTFFDYLQGDYGFRDITLGSETNVGSGGRLTFLGAGRSFSGEYSNLGPQDSDKNNVLQNYQLIFDHATEDHKIALGLHYHLENTGLPIESGNYENRSGESFHFGLTYARSIGKTKFDLSTAYQSGRFSMSELSFDNVTYWHRLSLSRTLRKKFTGYLDIKRKSVARQPNAVALLENRYTLLNTGLRWQDGPLAASFGTIFVGKAFFLTLGVDWTRPGFSIAFTRKTDNNLSADSLSALRNHPYTANELTFKAQITNLYAALNLTLLEWQNDNIPLLHYKLHYDLAWLHLDVDGMLTAEDSVLFDSRISSALRIDPAIPGKRYRPFIALTHSYTRFTGTRVLDLTTPDALAPFAGGFFSTNDLNFEIGFDVHNFRFTYHTDHLIADGVTYSPNLLPVSQLNYFQVQWIFEN